MKETKLALLLFPHVEKTVEDWEANYPKRNLPPNAKVLRFAPSPTGYFHIGGLFGVLIDYLGAKNSGGVFYLRLEDTDTKRKVERAGDIAHEMICKLGLAPDEGFWVATQGKYGPYVQSERKEIYHSFAKRFVELGHAYPCFCSKTEDKSDILLKRKKKLSNQLNSFAKDPCRSMSLEEVTERIDSKQPFALRLKSQGNRLKKFEVNDVFRGKRILRENEEDCILLKRDGLPPYAFAHMVDDYLMGTTHVIRAEEWYASTAKHIEICKLFGIPPFVYGHTPTISINDRVTGHKRKVSKRYDIEADMRFFFQSGYLKEAVIDYVLGLISSDFEPWRTKHPDAKIEEFVLSFDSVGTNNPYFDFVKLDSIARQKIARLSSEEVLECMLEWAKEFDIEWFELINANKDYARRVFHIERDEKRVRKDIAKWSEMREKLGFMFFEPTEWEDDGLQNTDLRNRILRAYEEVFDEQDDKTTWFEKIKTLANEFGFYPRSRKHEGFDLSYLGDITDFVTILRVAVMGKASGPDLFEVLAVLGKERMLKRIQKRSET